MKVLLIDLDSKIPNLALMKLSAYYKSRGDEIGFKVEDPSLIFASVIFKKNHYRLGGLSALYPQAKVLIGGTGYDLTIKLPREVEAIRPDYSLYPGLDYSMGFTTRGCIRNCPFCVVRRKEGEHQRWQHPEEFHDPSFKKMMLLDNNWIADREWFFETSEWIIRKGLKLTEHGLDIRLLDPEIAEQLKRIKFERGPLFAWDNERDIEAVERGITLLKEVGFDLRNKLQFYIYVGGDEDYESGVRRCRILKAMGTNPFVMVNQEGKITPRVRKLQRWANRKQIFWTTDIDQYARKGELSSRRKEE